MSAQVCRTLCSTRTVVIQYETSFLCARSVIYIILHKFGLLMNLDLVEPFRKESYTIMARRTGGVRPRTIDPGRRLLNRGYLDKVTP